MEPTEHPGEYRAFILRVWRYDAGGPSGVVERVKTGKKIQFHGLEMLGQVVASLLSNEEGGR